MIALKILKAITLIYIVIDKNPNINRYLVDSSLKYQYGLYLEFGVGNNFGANKLKWFPEIEELSK